MPLRRPLLDLRMSWLYNARAITVIMALLITVALPVLQYANTTAEQVTFRQLQLSDGTIEATNVQYRFAFNTITSSSIGSVTFEFCENYQYKHGDPCTTPVGFTAGGASLVSSVPFTEFTYNPSSTDNRVIVSRPVSSPVTPQPLTFELAGITNPSNVGSFYVRIETHASTDGSGPEIDDGVVVFATNIGIDITTEVPPYLLFCTGITIDGYNCGTAEGSFINFGELSSRTPRSATSQMLASTNAPYGYSITLAGQTMTAGTNVIPAMSGGVSQTGVSQFGINSRQNSQPGIGADPEGPGLTTASAGYNTPNNYKFQSGDIIASSNNTDDYRKLTVSYLVNVDANQPPGKYVATISYICLANF